MRYRPAEKRDTRIAYVPAKFPRVPSSSRVATAVTVLRAASPASRTAVFRLLFCFRCGRRFVTPAHLCKRGR